MSQNYQTINFSYNWNGKLNNKAFTTIRLHNPNKYKVGNKYDIELKNQPKGIAQLKEKRVLSLNQLNEFVCYLDTGYSKAETISIIKRMYKNVNLKTAMFDFCLLVYLNSKEVKPQQIELNL